MSLHSHISGVLITSDTTLCLNSGLVLTRDFQQTSECVIHVGLSVVLFDLEFGWDFPFLMPFSAVKDGPT